MSALVGIVGVALSAWRGDGDQSELAERVEPDRRSLIETTALVDNVRSGEVSISDHPDVEQAMKAVL